MSISDVSCDRGWVHFEKVLIRLSTYACSHVTHFVGCEEARFIQLLCGLLLQLLLHSLLGHYVQTVDRLYLVEDSGLPITTVIVLIV
jgi:hypothetical protein